MLIFAKCPSQRCHIAKFQSTFFRFKHSSPSLSPSLSEPLPMDATIAQIVLKSSNWQTLTKILRENSSFQWSNDLVDKVLKRLWNHGPKALEFFKAIERCHPQQSHSPSSYDHVIDIAARLRDFKSLWTLVAKMRSQGIGPSSKTFAIIIERYVGLGKPDRAVKIFLSMNEHGCPQDLNCFNTLLDILCKSKRVEKAQNLFKILRGRFRADVVSYNILANGWCLIKRTPKALEVLKEMVERGIHPTMTTYNIMLKGYLRAGQTKEAWDFFLEMKNRKCEIDVVTYTTLVHGFGVLGEIKKARRVFDGMIDDGVLPSVITYNAFIQVLCKKDTVANAILVFEEMLKKGYVPNSTTYNVLIRGLCHTGEMDKAMELLGQMKDDGCEPNVQTFNLLIRYYCDAGELEKGVEVFETMNQGECLPNLDTYNVLISSMFVRQKSDDLLIAGRLLVEMVERGFLPRRFTFNRVLNGLLLTGNQEFAKKILRMQSNLGRLPRHFRL